MAASLSFTSLLALVPLITVIFSALSGILLEVFSKRVSSFLRPTLMLCLPDALELRYPPLRYPSFAFPHQFLDSFSDLQLSSSRSADARPTYSLFTGGVMLRLSFLCVKLLNITSSALSTSTTLDSGSDLTCETVCSLCGSSYKSSRSGFDISGSSSP